MNRIDEKKSDMNRDQDISLKVLLPWLLSITRPVHAPLLFSTVMRIINLTADIVLFAVAGGGVAAVIYGKATIWQVLLLGGAVAAIKASAAYFEQFSGHYVAFKALELLRTNAYAKLWPQAPKVMTHARSGDLLTSLTRDVDRIEVVYAHTFAPVVAAFVVPTIAVSYVGIVYGWNLVWPTVVLVVISLLIVPFLGARAAFDSTRATLANRRILAHQVTDSVRGLDEVLGYGLEEIRMSQMDKIEQNMRSSQMVPRIGIGIRRALAIFIVIANLICVLWQGMHSDISLIILAGICVGFLRLFEGPRGIEDAVSYLDHSIAAAKRLWHICHTPPAVVDGPRPYTSDVPASIELVDLTYRYKDVDGTALKAGVSDISCSLEAGQTMMIVGASGSGKSTLAHLIARFDNPDSGQILIDGVDISSYELDSYRSHVVLVGQICQQLASDIATNLRLAAPEASDEELWQVLKVVEMDEEVRAMPEGLHTAVGERGTQMSGGQIQRLGLARSLLLKPTVMILDEFCANVNADLEEAIRANLKRYYPQMTIIEISHRLDHLSSADVIVMMDSGRVVQIASGKELDISTSSPLSHLVARDIDN